MSPGTVEIATSYVRRRVLGNVVVGSGFLAAFFAFTLYNSVSWAMERDGLSLVEALFSDTTRAMTIVTMACWAVLIPSLTYAVVGTPRRNTRQEVRVTRDGVELHAEPMWWYRGQNTLLRWADIQVISAQHTIVREKRGRRSTQRVAREVLDFYLYRDAGDLPFFASATKVTDAPLEGVVPPAQRVRIGGQPGEELAASVREVAPEVSAIHPDLFYRGIAVDQWYAPPSPEDEEPEVEASEGEALGGEEPAGGDAPSQEWAEAEVVSAAPPPEAGYALPAALWLDFRQSLVRTFATVVGLPILAAASFWVILQLNKTDGGVLLGLLGLAFVALFLSGLLGGIAAFVSLPVSRARCGIRIDAGGLEVVEKRSLFQGLDSRRIPWSDVQAIVARSSAALDEHGLRRAQKKAVTDIYLRGDTDPAENRDDSGQYEGGYADHDAATVRGFQRPGTGLSIDIASLTQPTSAYLGSLATFPALRLRFPHSPTAERGGAEAWGAVHSGASEPHTLPGSQFRAALFAARPDLCHGFEVHATAGR